MSSFLDRLLRRETKSASEAKERLKLVLIHDRTDLSPAEMEALKDDLIAAISRHIEIDPQAVRIDVSQEGRDQLLIANIPLKPARRKRST